MAVWTHEHKRTRGNRKIYWPENFFLSLQYKLSKFIWLTMMLIPIRRVITKFVACYRRRRIIQLYLHAPKAYLSMSGNAKSLKLITFVVSLFRVIENFKSWKTDKISLHAKRDGCTKADVVHFLRQCWLAIFNCPKQNYQKSYYL